MATSDSPCLQDKIKSNREIIKKYETLIAAAEGNAKKIESYLKDADNKMDCEDKDGNTILHYAVEGNSVEVVKVLLKCANIFDIIGKENINEETPFDVGFRLNHEEICCLLGDIIVKNTNASLPQELEKVIVKKNELEEKDPDFAQETFCLNYEASLSKNDIRNILLLKYPLCHDIFKICKLQNLCEKLLECRFLNDENSAPSIFIIDAGNLFWFALAIKYVKNCQSYEVSYGLVSNEIDRKLRVILSNQKCNYSPVLKFVKKSDSGIIAIEYAEICYKTCKFPDDDLGSKSICETRDFFANIINEKRRTEEKIKCCLELIRKLNKKNMYDVSHGQLKINYEEANVFILFLETFSLEDTYVNTACVEKAKKLQNRVRDVKKTFFRAFMQKESFDLITAARNEILHKKRTIEPADFAVFLCTADKKDFFEEMEIFTETVHKNVKNPHDKMSLASCKGFLKPLNKQEEIGRNAELYEVFSLFLKNFYEPHSKKQSENLEKILFDLTVNIMPVLSNRNEKVKSLSAVRNELIHNFQNFESNEERLEEVKKLTFLKSDFYKYYYSGKIHDILKTLKGSDSPEVIENRFKESLEDSEEIEFLRDRKIIASETEAKNDWVYDFGESLFPKKNEDVRELASDYLKYMMIVDCAEFLDLEEGHMAFCEYNYKKVDDIERREIFEEFLKLKKFYNNTNNSKKWLKTKIYQLKKKLINDYGVQEYLYNKVVDMYVKNNKDIIEQNRRILNDITSVLITISNIMEENQNLSDFDVISIYQQYCKSKTVFTLKECADLPAYKYKRSKSLIEKGINRLRRIGNRKFSITPTEHIQINAEQVIVNMLKTFYSAYHKYQIKFCNVEAAFSDETFLNYLVDRDIELVDKKCQIKSTDRMVWLIKKLLKIDFTAPYIATLIGKGQSFDLIEQDDLIKLTRLLLEKQSHKEFLMTLLNVVPPRVDDHVLYEEISKWLLRGNTKIDNLQVVFKNPEHVKGILKCVNKNLGEVDEKKSEKVTKILELLNSTLREAHYDHHYHDILGILKSEEVESLIQKARKKDVNLVKVEVKYLVAQIKNKLKKNSEANEILEEEITKFSDTDKICKHYMLILEEIAYTYKMQKKYKHSVTKYEELYSILVQYVLGYEIKGLSNENTKHIKETYEKIQNSEKYQKLLIYFEGFNSSKYFDVLGILENYAHTKQLSEDTLNNFKIVMTIAKTIYSCSKNNLKIYNKNSIPIRTMQQIASLYYIMGEMQKQKSPHYFHNALLWELKSLRSQKQKHGNRHPIIIKRMVCMTKNLNIIASIYSSKENYDKAISATEKLHKFKDYSYESTINSQQSMREIKKLMEALKTGGKIYQEATEKQINLYEGLKKTKKIKKRKQNRNKQKNTIFVPVFKRKGAKRRSSFQIYVNVIKSVNSSNYFKF